MKVNHDQLKLLQKYLSVLSEDGIDIADEGDYFGETEYEDLPDVIEIDEIRLCFPDDQDIFSIDPEKFVYYVEEIDTLRRENRIIVRTDHIVQVMISSDRVGFTKFEDILVSFKFRGVSVHAKVVKQPFLIGVMNARDGYYDEDLGLGPCGPYMAIEIRLDSGAQEANINELIERICFFLTDKTGVAVYPWEGPDFEEMYEVMNEYDGEEDGDEGVDGVECEEIELSSLPHYTPLLKMYRQAKEVIDPEIQFLHFYKMIEFVSPSVAKSVAYEHLNKRLDMLPKVKRDCKYLDSILAVARKYDKDLRDDSLALATIENCVDVVPLFGMLPVRMLKKVKSTLQFQKDVLTDSDINDGQLIALQKQIASILYATRNSIVHAKSNYMHTGYELTLEELDDANKMMEVIAQSIINWNERQPDGFRV